MNAIRTFLLRAHHWQLFALLAGFLASAQLIVVRLDPVNRADLRIPLAALLVALVCWFCIAYWFWCLGSFLHSRVRFDLRLSLPFFRFALAYPVIYVTFFQLAFARLVSSPIFFLTVLPFHLFAFYCVLFDLYFISKGLLMAEKHRNVKFLDYGSAFFLLWVFPIGIWFLQPRINRLYLGEGLAESAALSS
jgi:hypothetical protein